MISKGIQEGNTRFGGEWGGGNVSRAHGGGEGGGRKLGKGAC